MAEDESMQRVGKVRHEISLEKLEPYLRTAVPEISLPLEVEQFTYGQSNPTYFLTDHAKRKYVLRKKPAGKLLSKTAHAIEREYQVLAALAHTEVPTPKVYCLCEDNQVLGTPFYIMEFLKGRIFTDPSLPEVSHTERLALWKAATQTLAKLHKVDFRAVGLEKFGRAGGYYIRQMKTFKIISETQAATEDIKTKGKVGSVPHQEGLLEWFPRNLPKDRTSIVHGDYKLDNMVFHPTKPEVIGLLDWELSTIGHPLSDLANLTQPLLLSTEAQFTVPHPNGSFPPLETVLEWYSSEAGWDPRSEFSFANAFCLWRTGIISQGIAARNARGQASSAEAKRYGMKMFPLGELAWKTVVEYEGSRKSVSKADGKAKSKL